MTIDNNTGEKISELYIVKVQGGRCIDIDFPVFYDNHSFHSWVWDNDDDDHINDDEQNYDEVLKAKCCPCKTRLYSAKSFYELFRHI